jgi:signal transduction histidine kinase/ligand-binding sensor domain-containing protein
MLSGSGILTKHPIPMALRLLTALTRLAHVCAFVGAGLCLSAQSPNAAQPHFQQLQKTLDLPPLSIIAFTRAEDGMLWLITYDELLRFDGANLKRHPLREPQSGMSRFHSLHADNQNYIWIGGSGQVHRWNLRTQTWDSIAVPTPDASVPVTEIQRDPQGILRAIDANGRLYRWNPDENRFQLDVDPSMPVASAQSMLVDHNGRIWVGANYQIFEYLPDTKSVRKVFEMERKDPHQPGFFHSIVEHPDGELIAASWTGQLVRWNPDTDEAKTIPIDGYVFDLGVDPSGQTWVGSSVGLTVFSRDLREAYPYRHESGNPDSIPAGSVRNVLADRWGNLWLNTSRSGLITIACAPFESLHYQASWNKILPRKDNVCALHIEANGRIWLGYHNDGIEVIHPSGEEQPFKIPAIDPTNPAHPPKGSVWLIKSLPNERYLIGTSDASVSLTDAQLSHFETLKPDASSPAHPGGTDLRATADGPDGKKWLIYHFNNIDAYDPVTGAFEHLFHAENRLRKNRDTWLYAAHFDQRKRLWICASDGLIVADEGRTVDESALDRLFPNHSLDGQAFHCIMERPDRSLWIGGPGGLYKLEPENGKITHFRHVDALKGKSIQSIMSDASGHLWLATQDGLVRFHPQTEEAILFGSIHGIPGTDFYPNACARDPHGYLYFGSKHGVVRFLPDQITPEPAPIHISFSSFRLYNREIPVARTGGLKGPVLKESIEWTRKIQLPFQAYTMTFHFTATSPRHAHLNLFSYKMHGFDENWSSPSTRRDCTYTNLSPGNYTLEVKACNHQGIWSPLSAQIDIRILPPLWKRGWFLALLLMAIVALMRTAYLLRMRRIRSQRDALKVEVQERTRELNKSMSLLSEQKARISQQNEQLLASQDLLEQRIRERTRELEIAKNQAEASDRLKSAFLANISHEFRTPMNAIIGSAAVLCEPDCRPEEKEEFRKLLEAHCHYLVRLVDDVITLSAMEAGSIQMKSQLIEPNVLLSQLLDMALAYQVAEGKNHLQVLLETPEVPLPESHTWISDEKALLQIGYHLLSNAIKFTPNGSIRFGIHWNPEKATQLNLYVQDSGIGIPAAQQPMIFRQFTRFDNQQTILHKGTGIGLRMVQKLAESLQATIDLQSSPGKGTRITLTFPIQQIQA